VSGSPPDRKPTDPSTWIGTTTDRIGSLSEYFAKGADQYTPEALRRAASESGFSPDEIEQASARAEGRRRADDSVRPIRQRARRIVLAAYGLVYLVFAVLFLTSSNRYGGGIIALIILTIVLGIALLISVTWVNRRRPTAEQLEGALLTMLALPLVLLVTVAGLCAASARPTAFGLF
jgi:hypothetical protein